MHTGRNIAILLTALVPALFASEAPDLWTIDSLAIVAPEISREVVYTNKTTAFFYTETHSTHRSSWQGLNVGGTEYLDDYSLVVDGSLLPRSEARNVIVYPDRFVRTYRSGIREEVFLADSIPLLAITITSPTPIEVGVLPFLAGVRGTGEVTARASREQITMTRTAWPGALTLHGSAFLPIGRDTVLEKQYAPGFLYSSKRKSHLIVFAVGETPETARAFAARFAGSPDRFRTERRSRMEALLSRTEFRSDNREFDRAFAWARLSLDALIMNQGRKGIYAGLPWFNNYWGRDTFISLPGTSLVTGEFREAREILRSFVSYQQRDTASPDYGRIPNVVNPGDRSYNTADGTPRFVMMAREYVDRSGDTLFMREVYPAILRAADGTLRYHTDSLGFLTHADAETWMDAAGPAGPWSPRGDRANDIQALWAGQLESSMWFAAELGDYQSAELWGRELTRLRKNFMQGFLTGGRIADHLNEDGTRDSRLRPNQIFAGPLLDDTTRVKVLRLVVDSLTYRHGVASLSQDDPNFHPYHVNPPFYPKDAAYHNGTVWTWLQGPVVSELCRFGRPDLAFEVTADAVHQILDRGAVGTQSELLDAVPRVGATEPDLSGTCSQAWNLAEFIRNLYDDFLGIRVSRYRHLLELRPHLPGQLGSVRAIINLDGRRVPLSIRREGGKMTSIALDARELRRNGSAIVEWSRTSDSLITVVFEVIPGTSYVLSGTSHKPVLLADGRPVTAEVIAMPVLSSRGLDGAAFRVPAIRPGLRSLQGPSHPVLNHAEVKKRNDEARMLITLEDPTGDDDGGSSYSYPLNPAFVPGCADITGFTVTYDSLNAYVALRFRALSDPGWHPEYGFQLTFAAIAIDTDRVSGSGNAAIGHNAQFRLHGQGGFERLILVGGGLQVENDRGEILAGYLPGITDVSNPLGDAGTGVISFAMPLQYLGKPDRRWRFTVLAGLQDDHGGAGLGEFRSVNNAKGDWSGGGKRNPDDHNVYDVLEGEGE